MFIGKSIMSDNKDTWNYDKNIREISCSECGEVWLVSLNMITDNGFICRECLPRPLL